LAARSRNSPTTGLAPMEAEYIRHSCYSLPFQASIFFLLALLIRLSGKSHDLNYNNCLLGRFPTRLFLVLNLAHMPEHPFFPELLAEIGHRGPRATIHARHCRRQHGPCRVGHRGVGHRGGAGHIGDGHGGAGYRGASHGGADHRGAGHRGAGYKGACYGGAGQKSGGLDSGAETTVEELTKSTMGEYSWRTLMSTKGEQARIRSAKLVLVK